MLDDDSVIVPIVTKYQQSPPQYKRLLKDLRHALQVDWIGENLSEAVDLHALKAAISALAKERKR